MRRCCWLRFMLLTALVACGLGPLPRSAEPEAPRPAPGVDEESESVGAKLEAIRDQLVGLRFEKALDDVQALLGLPRLSESERVEALVLGSQAHVALGDLKGAEVDYREILRLRPAYVPEASLTPRKAMERFTRVQAELVGRLELVLDPPDARVWIDGREVSVGPAGVLALLAGERVFRAERDGFDPFEKPVTITPGKDLRFELQLVPNARTVVVLTEPEGVEVVLDGAPMGVTAASAGGSRQPAELRIENLPLGEHRIELRKPCFRGELLRDILVVDLLDRSPKRYGPVRLAPVRSTLELRGGPAGAQVRLDGQPAGQVSRDPLELCPGEHRVELMSGARVLWSSREQLLEAETRVVEIDVRPNVALVGASAWPSGLGALAGRFNETTGITLPRGSDLSVADAWTAVELPAGTDVALAVVPRERDSANPQLYLYSPILRAAGRLEAVPADLDRPRWYGSAWGARIADSQIGGPARVVEVASSGPAAAAGLRPGDRLLSIGGEPVAGAGQLRAMLDRAAPGSTVSVRWLTPAGETREAAWRGARSPRLLHGSADLAQAALRAAWAAADAAGEPSQAACPLANLALLFSAFGQSDLAVETWRKVNWGERAGVGGGTTLYYLGRELEVLGREGEAVEAYRAAAASEATAFDDEGPPVAPAARDRLFDLGVTPP